MLKQNCWEFKKCGREYRGARVSELGLCKVSVTPPAHGLHSGQHGGRACWGIAGTMNGSKVDCIFAKELNNCLQCDFFQKVRSEEKACVGISKNVRARPGTDGELL
jgi:hypothetical protein